ncbi:MAG: hypothetical protein H0T71_13650 [Acidobacteria bacterium]|nr:hypothetical protein [Acidobacteriota bacterium]
MAQLAPPVPLARRDMQPRRHPVVLVVMCPRALQPIFTSLPGSARPIAITASAPVMT